MDYTVHRILQARILEWVAFPFSRISSQPRDPTPVSCIAGWFLPAEPQGVKKMQQYDLILCPVRAISMSSVFLRLLTHTFVILSFTWTTLHLLVIIFVYMKSKIRFHKGRQEASAHSDNIYNGKMCVKYVNLSICLISHLHIKDSIERIMVIFMLSPDKGNEKKLQGEYTSLLW